MAIYQDDVYTSNHFRTMTQGVARFRGQIFPQERALYQRLIHEGQKPKALMISCADSRVIPEMITQSGPGELFVCRNAGNVVPPYAQMNGGVSSSIEYAVLALGVRDIVVCGHSDCGAMKALLCPTTLASMPNVAAWLRHSRAAEDIVAENSPNPCANRNPAASSRPGKHRCAGTAIANSSLGRSGPCNRQFDAARLAVRNRTWPDMGI